MTVRVGFAGAGGIAGAHMNMLQAIEGVQISAVADKRMDRARTVAARYVAKAYETCAEMLDAEELDALYVCVPPFAHDDLEITAAKRGIHLFVEKPIALSMEKARIVRDAVRVSGIVTAVGYHWRYQSNTDKARELLAAKTVGMVQGYWMSGFPEVSWWRRMELSGGQVLEQTTHIFDLARCLCGDITEVYAAYAVRASGNIDDFDVYDVGTATVKFESGAIGCFSNTCLLSQPYTVGLHIVARDLVIELHGDMKVIEPGHTEIFSAGQNPMLEESRAFIHAVQTGDRTPIRSDYEDAVKSLAVSLACNESAASGMPAVVPLE